MNLNMFIWPCVHDFSGRHPVLQMIQDGTVKRWTVELLVIGEKKLRQQAQMKGAVTPLNHLL